jgi:hypothetical protein
MLLIQVGQPFTPKDIRQSFLFRDLFAGHGNDIGEGVIMMTAFEVFRFRGPVKGIGAVGLGKAKRLKKQHFQAVLFKFLTTDSGKLFQARTLFHGVNA